MLQGFIKFPNRVPFQVQLQYKKREKTWHTNFIKEYKAYHYFKNIFNRILRNFPVPRGKIIRTNTH